MRKRLRPWRTALVASSLTISSQSSTAGLTPWRASTTNRRAAATLSGIGSNQALTWAGRLVYRGSPDIPTRVFVPREGVPTTIVVDFPWKRTWFTPERCEGTGLFMYIGIGTVVLILVILLIIALA